MVEIRICPKCFTAFAADRTICPLPECGHIFTAEDDTPMDNELEARFCIDHAKKFPYNKRSAGDCYELAAQAVLADLCDRRGIKQELQEIECDEDISEEIVTTLAAIIKAAVTQS